LFSRSTFQLCGRHGHTGAIDADIENAHRLDRLNGRTLAGVPRDLWRLQIEHTLDLPSLDLQSRIGFQIGAGGFVAGGHGTGATH
jgi:hypothetical protein